MSDHDVDLFVIGAGSGGVRAARIAAAYGARVMIAEEYRVGGTCVIRGCVPKKLLVYASRFSEEFEDAAGYGWTVPEPVSYTHLRAHETGRNLVCRLLLEKKKKEKERKEKKKKKKRKRTKMKKKKKGK